MYSLLDVYGIYLIILLLLLQAFKMRTADAFNFQWLYKNLLENVNNKLFFKIFMEAPWKSNLSDISDCGLWRWQTSDK